MTKFFLQRKQGCQAVHVHVLITKFNLFGFQIRDIVGFLVAGGCGILNAYIQYTLADSGE